MIQHCHVQLAFSLLPLTSVMFVLLLMVTVLLFLPILEASSKGFSRVSVIPFRLCCGSHILILCNTVYSEGLACIGEITFLYRHIDTVHDWAALRFWSLVCCVAVVFNNCSV